MALEGFKGYFANIPKRQIYILLAVIAAGVVAAAYAGRLIGSLLFGVEAYHPPTFVGVVLLVFTAALVAGYVPARRATKVDPMVALRYE